MGIQKVQNELGRRLKSLRMEGHLTQEQVASEVEMSRDHLSNIENGKYDIRFTTLLAIMNALNVPFEKLYDKKNI